MRLLQGLVLENFGSYTRLGEDIQCLENVVSWKHLNVLMKGGFRMGDKQRLQYE